MSELRECPFCGSDNVTLGSRPSTYVECEDCGAEGPWNDDGDEARAASLWNRRADDRYELTDAGKARVEGVK